jgi:hypothetical protein
MVLVILLITGLYIGTVAAIPVIPEEWYGSVVLDGSPAPAGTVIVVQVNGNNSGQLTTTEQGLYGSLSGQNNLFAQINDQEFTKGTPTVTFLVNGIQAYQAVPYQSGNLSKLDIYADSKAAPSSLPTIVSSGPSGSSGSISGSSQPSAGGFPVISVSPTASDVQGTTKPGNTAGNQAGSSAASPNSPAGQNTGGVGNSPSSVNASVNTGSLGSLSSTTTAGILVVVVVIVIAIAYLMRKKGKI